jgi:phospholipid/cholesterol/gamma-HCH transport system ATP-binding protein
MSNQTKSYANSNDSTVIEFQNIRKSFGSREVIRGVNFKIKEGEILFILGTSGTGKSVTLKMLVGLLKPTSGRILVDNEDITDFSELEFLRIRKKCGMVFQHPALFDSMSIFENVAYGLRKLTQMTEEQIAARVKTCLELVHVTHDTRLLPQSISYGTQKRVSLARTVANSPKILLFDEPTTGLDPITTNAVNKLIFELSRQLKTTSIVVSHDMHCALEIADRIIVLDKGEIIAEGTPTEIRHSPVPLVKDFMSEVENENH